MAKRKRLVPEELEDGLCRVKKGVRGWVCKSGTRNWKPFTTTEDQEFETYTESGTAVVFERAGWKLMVRMKDATGLNL